MRTLERKSGTAVCCRLIFMGFNKPDATLAEQTRWRGAPISPNYPSLFTCSTSSSISETSASTVVPSNAARVCSVCSTSGCSRASACRSAREKLAPLERSHPPKAQRGRQRAWDPSILHMGGLREAPGLSSRQRAEKGWSGKNAPSPTTRSDSVDVLLAHKARLQAPSSLGILIHRLCDGRWRWSFTHLMCRRLRGGRPTGRRFTGGQRRRGRGRRQHGV